jgi:hypothetical protein
MCVCGVGGVGGWVADSCIRAYTDYHWLFHEMTLSCLLAKYVLQAQPSTGHTQTPYLESLARDLPSLAGFTPSNPLSTAGSSFTPASFSGAALVDYLVRANAAPPTSSSSGGSSSRQGAASLAQQYLDACVVVPLAPPGSAAAAASFQDSRDVQYMLRRWVVAKASCCLRHLANLIDGNLYCQVPAQVHGPVQLELWRRSHNVPQLQVLCVIVLPCQQCFHAGQVTLQLPLPACPCCRDAPRRLPYGQALNTHYAWGPAPVRPATQVAEDLRQQILALYDAHLSPDGRRVSYSGMQQDPRFWQYVDATAELQWVCSGSVM